MTKMEDYLILIISVFAILYMLHWLLVEYIYEKKMSSLKGFNFSRKNVIIKEVCNNCRFDFDGEIHKCIEYMVYVKILGKLKEIQSFENITNAKNCRLSLIKKNKRK